LVSPASILHIAEHALKNNKKFTLNISGPFIPNVVKDDLNKVVEYVDYLFGNEAEALSYAKANGQDLTDIKEVAKYLASLPTKNNKTRTVVITQGADPTIVVHEGKVHEFPVPKIEKSKIVDTNGAGDCFVGGFLSQLIKGKDIEECVK